MAKIIALGEKQFFVYDFELTNVEEAATELSLAEIVAILGETLNQDHLDANFLQRIAAPLLRFLKESQVYQVALKDPSKDGFMLTVFREPNNRKGRVYRADWLGSVPTSVLTRDPINLTLQVMKNDRKRFDPSRFHKKSKVREIMKS